MGVGSQSRRGELKTRHNFQMQFVLELLPVILTDVGIRDSRYKKTRAFGSGFFLQSEMLVLNYRSRSVQYSNRETQKLINISSQSSKSGVVEPDVLPLKK